MNPNNIPDQYNDGFSYSYLLAAFWFVVVLWVSGVGSELWRWLVVTITPKRVLLWRADVLRSRLCDCMDKLEKERQNALKWQAMALGNSADIDYDEVIAAERAEREEQEEERNRHGVNKDFQKWQRRQGGTGQEWKERAAAQSDYEIDFDVTK